MARRLFIQHLTLVGVIACSACDHPELNSDPGAIRFVAEAQIGTVEGPVALSFPIGALMLGTDTLLLAQLSAAHLLVLSVDGDSLGTVGRAGSGPGEFSLPMPSAVRGDSLWIIDGRTVHLWSRALEPVSQFTLALDPLGEFQSGPRPRTVLADGTLLYEAPINTIAAARGQVDTLPLVRVSVDGQILDTIASRSARGCCYEVWSEEGRGLTGAHPADQSDRIVHDPRGEWIAVLAIESRDGIPHAVMHRLSISGDTLASIDLPSPSVPVGTLEDRWVGESCERHSDWPEGACRRAMGEWMSWPDFLPAVEAAFADSDGRVWVRSPHTSADSARWTLVQEDDQILGSGAIPSHIRLLTAKGNTAWGWYQGDFDVPYLVRFRVEFEGSG